MRHYMNYHMIAFVMGFLLDLVLGDPYYLPHPMPHISAITFICTLSSCVVLPFAPVSLHT